MQYPAQVQASIELLAESMASHYPADRLMAGYFRQRRYIGSKDKAVISELFYQLLRNRLSLAYLIEEVGLPLEPRLLVAVLLHLEEKNLPVVFSGNQYQPRPLGANERSALRCLSQEKLQGAPEHVRLNVPHWLEAELKQSLGSYYPQELHAVQRRAATDVRANEIKVTREQLQAEFADHNFRPEVMEYSPWGLRFAHRVALFNLPMFKEGAFEVQDQGSQLLALLTDAKAGQTVVDFCAGAGGKTLALAAMMQNKGSIYACDVHSRRLQELAKRTKRAGVHNVRVHHLSSEHDKWVKKHSQKADVVLIDAPCSGTGTWRRNPESRWNLSAERLHELISIQSSILASAARLVKPGGHLLYATCSLLASENQDQVETFLEGHLDFTVVPFNALGEQLKLDKRSIGLQLLSSQHETDGFYVAKMQRKSSLD